MCLFRLALGLLLLFFSCSALAQQLEPRAYSPSPVGTSFLVVGFARSTGGVTVDPTVPIADIQAKLNAPFLGLGKTFGLFRRQSLIAAVLPYVWGEVSGSVGEQRRSVRRSGLADAGFRFAVNIVGSPALTPNPCLLILRCGDAQIPTGADPRPYLMPTRRLAIYVDRLISPSFAVRIDGLGMLRDVHADDPNQLRVTAA